MTRAFTLIELVVAMVTVSILLGAITGIMSLAANVIPEGTDISRSLADVTNGVELMNAELAEAITVTAVSDTAITFTVADRDADDVEETITYTWTGSQLERTADGRTGALFEAAAFDFDTTTTTVTTISEASVSEQADAIVDDLTLVIAGWGVGISKTKRVSIAIDPTLPPDTISWRVTAIEMRIGTYDSYAAEDRIHVELQHANGSREPEGDLVALATLDPALLPAPFSWVRVEFPGERALDPSDDAAIVVFSTTDSAEASWYYGVAVASDGSFKYSSDGGASWTGSAGFSGPYRIYARATVETPAGADTTTEHLIAVGMTTTPPGEGVREIRSTVQLVNSPVTP